MKNFRIVFCVWLMFLLPLAGWSQAIYPFINYDESNLRSNGGDRLA